VNGAESGEVLIAGELLAPGGGNQPHLDVEARVLGTLLHEAAHALASVRGIKDTSRGGRYHNVRYRGLAEEVGLSCATCEHGWCFTGPTDETMRDYAAELGALRLALVGFRAPESAGAKRKKGVSGWLKATCGCRSIRVARATFEMGEIECVACGESFGLEEREEEA
jgi:hypothetical protein